MKIGLIGYGNIAKKHEKAISQINELQLKSVYDLTGIDNDSLVYYKELDQFLKSGNDIITVCSPNGFHKEHSIRALETGHHVICEKPLALSVRDSHEMLEVARKCDKKLFCTMQNRFSPVSQWLKSLVTQKALGDIYLVNVACYWNRNKDYYSQSAWRGNIVKDGGTLFTQFSHYVDTIYWLFGNMNIISANFNNFDHEEMIDFEDTGLFNFTLDQGGMGTFSYTTSCYEKNFESSLTIIGSKGTIKVAGQYMDTIAYCNLKEGTPPELPKNDNIGNIVQLYHQVIDEINSDSKALSSAHDASQVVHTIEKVYRFR